MTTTARKSLVGRVPELARIEAALSAARSGELSGVLLAGEAGVGKTRLVAEVKARASSEGWTVLEGASFEFDRSVPLAPFADLVRTFLLQAPPEAARRTLEVAGQELSGVVPELESQLGGVRPVEALGPDEEKQRAFNGVCSLVALRADSAPVLVVVEDLHWSDDASLELFLVLARRLRTRTVMLLGTYRSDEVEGSLASAVAQLTRARLGDVIELRPFGPEETAEFVERIVGAGNLRPEVLRGLHALTEGNALFLEEVGKSLGTAVEALEANSGATQMPLGVVRPPESIREAVRRRTGRLSPGAGRVLSVAAVAGRRFEFDLLSAVTGVDEGGLVPLLRELVDAHLVTEELPDRFAFRHALTQQAVLAGMLSRERRQLHLQIASAILQRSAVTDVPDLANHFFQAEAWEQAAEYARQAGERAMTMFSPKAAAEQFDRAVLAIETLGREPDWELLWSRARSHDTLGDFEPARAGYEAAVGAARRIGDPRKEWQGLVDLGLLWSARDYHLASRHLEESLRLARTLDDASLLAQSLNRVGNFHVNALHPREAMVLHGEALAISEHTKDEPRIAECYDLLGMASFQSADLVAADAYYERAVAAFRELDDRFGLASALAVRALCGGSCISDTEVACGRTQDAQLRDVEEALALAEASGWRAGAAFACAVIAWILIARGEYQQALETGRRSLAVAEEIDHRQWVVAACCALGRLHGEVLAEADALHYLERGFALARELQSPLWICNIGGSLVSLLARAGELERARVVLAEVTAHLGSKEAMHVRTSTVAAALLAIESGKPADALDMLERLEDDAERCRPVPLLYHLRGAALAGLGRLEEADANFVAAAELAASLGLRPQLWRSQLELGRVARMRGQRARAAAAFAAARATATELADELRSTELLEPFQTALERLLPAQREPTEAQAAKRAYEGLTARERDIASLIARGLTNRAIAESLTLSERTVEAHVSNILAKLTLTSRAQIATWATERGLPR